MTVVKIAQFIDTPTFGGAEAVLLNLLLHLPAPFTGELHHFGNCELEERCHTAGIPTVTAPGYTAYKSTKTLPLFAMQYGRFLRARGVSILHSHLFGPVTAGALAARFAGVRHVGTLHDEYLIAEKPARIHLLWLAAVLGTHLVTVSRSIEHFLRTQGRFAPGAFKTIYNGVDVDTPPPPLTRAALGIRSEERVVVTVGRLVPLKRQEWLIEALQPELKRGEVKLLIVGDGPCRASLQRIAEQLGVFEQVVFLGYRSDVNAVLPLADLFAMSSETEGMSCSILEAMAARLPVVATRVGGNGELVTEGVTGFLANEIVSLRASLVALLHDQEKRKLFGAAGYERIAGEFSVSRMVQRYATLYQRVNLGEAATNT